MEGAPPLVPVRSSRPGDGLLMLADVVLTIAAVASLVALGLYGLQFAADAAPARGAGDVSLENAAGLAGSLIGLGLFALGAGVARRMRTS